MIDGSPRRELRLGEARAMSIGITAPLAMARDSTDELLGERTPAVAGAPA